MRFEKEDKSLSFVIHENLWPPFKSPKTWESFHEVCKSFITLPRHGRMLVCSFKTRLQSDCSRTVGSRFFHFGAIWLHPLFCFKRAPRITSFYPCYTSFRRISIKFDARVCKLESSTSATCKGVVSWVIPMCLLWANNMELFQDLSLFGGLQEGFC